MPPALLASAGISLAVLVLFIATLLQAVGLPSGTGGRIRLLQFLSPADLAVGTAMIVAVGLVELYRQQLARQAEPAPADQPLDAGSVMAIASVVAAALTVAAVVRAIVELTVSGRSGSLRTGNFLDAIAGALVAAAAAWWGFRSQD
jgi:hypothetical protein